MYLAQVIPFSKGVHKEELTYFSTLCLKSGDLVQISLRNKNVLGLVTSVRPADEVKTEIKRSNFPMKKILKLVGDAQLSESFFVAVSKTADYYASTSGSILRTVIPTTINPELLTKVAVSGDRGMTHFDKFILQGEYDDRYSSYKSFIREEFAKRNSVIFVLPTIQDIERAETTLRKGIEDYTFVLHSGLTKKKIHDVYTQALISERPVLIITTGQYIHLPRKDIGAIVVDNESSRNFKVQSKPYLDFRIFALEVSRAFQCKFVLGDVLLSAETFNAFTMGEFSELSPLKQRSLSRALVEVVDMRVYKSTPKRFSIFSDDVVKMVEDNKNKNTNMFILSARKGLSAHTVCGDCGKVVSCEKCDKGMVLHEGTKENFFLCHNCGERKSAHDTCVKCGSWKLLALGIGIDRVAEEVKKLCPDSKKFVMDRDKITTQRKAVELIETFYNTPGSVLIGTEMALHYLGEGIDNVVVASLDSMFSVPDFRMNERILRMLIELRSVAQERLIIQTRRPDELVFEAAVKANLAEYVRAEIDERKKFNNPPFSVLIKITIEGKKDIIASQMSDIKLQLKDFEFDVFPSYVRGKNGQAKLNGLLRIKADLWPNPEVIEIIKSLPQNISVIVDPDSL